MAADADAILTVIQRLKSVGLIRRGCVYSTPGIAGETVLVTLRTAASPQLRQAVRSRLMDAVGVPAVPVQLKFREDPP